MKPSRFLSLFTANAHLNSISTRLRCLCLCIALTLYFRTTQCIPIQETPSVRAEVMQQQQQQQQPVSGDYQFIPQQLTPYMQVHKLLNPSTTQALPSSSSNNVTCNDGSPVGYYMRLNSHSKSWIIHLQGGGFCGSEQSCQQRWQRTPHLMSSNYWPETKSVDGILSSEPKENPYLWNANHIYVPYCSSDSWTGLSHPSSEQQQQQQQQQQTTTGDDMVESRSSAFSFMGSKIIERVLESLYEDLPRESSLYEAKFVLLAGDSAGATGVIMNLDKINSFVEAKAISAKLNCTNAAMDQVSLQNCNLKQMPVLRGLADSGWFLDNEPYDFSPRGDSYTSERPQDDSDNCDQYRCGPLQSIKQAMRFWNGQVPASCAERHPKEPWRCYFGYRAYQSLKTPLFVVQWLYDEAQLMVDRIARPDSSNQWSYVYKVVNEMRLSLENVTALFAPSCFSHSLITRKTWNQININGLKLPHVLNSWEEQSLLDTTSAAQPPQQNLSPLAIASMSATINKGAESARFHMNAVEGSANSAKHHSALTHISTLQPAMNSEQPTFEALVVDSEVSGSSGQIAYPQYLRDSNNERAQYATPNEELTRIAPKQQPATSQSSARQRGRKRRRHNNQRPKARQRASTEAGQSYTTELSQISSTKESNDLTTSTNPLQDCTSHTNDRFSASPETFVRSNHDTLGESFNNGRLGRSTLIDDSSLMLSNNVPEDNTSPHLISTSLAEQRQSDSRLLTSEARRESPVQSYGHYYAQPINRHSNVDNQFRLIDSCGWPQCNRDCPVLDSYYTHSGLIQPF